MKQNPPTGVAAIIAGLPVMAKTYRLPENKKIPVVKRTPENAAQVLGSEPMEHYQPTARSPSACHIWY